MAAVLCFHGELGFARGGFLGVSTFFTLSGFLITSLLLLEWEDTGRIDLRIFWTRRARRLLPAALVALVGIAAYAAYVAGGHEANRIGGDGLSALFYVANWWFVIGDQSYAALFSAPSPVQHFWSLAIEEQFYVLFPLFAVALLPRVRTRRRFQLVLVALAVGSAGLAWLLWSPGQDPSRVYYGTDTRAVELLIGAALAGSIAGRRSTRVRGRRVTAAGAGVVAAVALGVLWGASSQGDTFLYRGGLPLNAILTAVVIAGAYQPGPVRSALSWRPLRALGLISYGAYLYHWPIFLWLNPARVGIGGLPLFVVRITVTITVAVVSYRFLEAPIRRGQRLTGWRPRVMAPLGAATAGVLLLAVPGSPAGSRIVFAAVNQQPAVHQPAPTTTTLPISLPITGPDPASVVLRPPPVKRVMVVGDSVAQTLGRGLERWGPAHGFEVLNAARLWCPIARGGRIAASFGKQADTCADWPTRWPALAADFHPDVVVVLTTIWDSSHRQRDEWGPHYLGPGDARFDSFIATEWSEAVRVLRATGARVVWLAPPCARDHQSNLGLQYGNDHFLVAAVTAGAIPIDLAHRVCPEGVFRDSTPDHEDTRPDGLHFSDSGADEIARWLGPQVANPMLGIAVTPSGRVRRM